MILTIGAYAGAVSAVISLMLTIYKLIAVLNRLILEIDRLNHAVHTLFKNQQRLARAIHPSTEGGVVHELLEPAI